MAKIEKSKIAFAVESIILREFGERLVKRPEIAIMELIKNAYDADATSCKIYSNSPDSIIIKDNGCGMTIEDFKEGWMKIGTHMKSDTQRTLKYEREITGEKGLGRFSVRFLGHYLKLTTVAFNQKLKKYTSIVSEFDWSEFNHVGNLDKVEIPYTYDNDCGTNQTGTTLKISDLRVDLKKINYKRIRTSALDLESPIYNLFSSNIKNSKPQKSDPGLSVKLQEYQHSEPIDAVESVLNSFSLQVKIRLEKDKLRLYVFVKESDKPILKIIDTYSNELRNLSADIRFFPKRKGVLTNLPVDVNKAFKFIRENSGVAVFDRGFRVEPYGNDSDDWLELLLDAGKSVWKARSKISQKHFPELLDVENKKLRQWMLRLPKPNQLIGIVEIEGERYDSTSDKGLIASADREGFVENKAYFELFDIIRGAAEAIAFMDRKLQLEEQEQIQIEIVSTLKKSAQDAIHEIEKNPNINKTEKIRITSALTRTFSLAERHDELAREREQQLEIMSLLGVVAGYLTHEFGVAIFELESVHKECLKLANECKKFKDSATKFEKNIQNLKDFAMYTEGYIHGVKHIPEKRYPVKPRIDQVIAYFGKYAESRNIEIINETEPDLMAPLVPAALYNGVALNLYTNAIKAIMAKISSKRETIKFRAWNEQKWHILEVLDSGIGIPNSIRDRVFEPFFTTSDSEFHPLDSGMGLGLALVQRVMKVFGGYVDFSTAPTGFSTCIRVKLPQHIKKG